MSDEEGIPIVGFGPAAPEWYVIDVDDEGRLFHTVIVGWLYRVDGLAIPISPEASLANYTSSDILIGPDGKVSKQNEQTWANFDEYEAWWIDQQGVT